MSAKLCHLWDCPEGFREEFDKVLSKSQHTFDGTCVLNTVKLSIEGEKYIIKVPDLKFVGEFYQDGDAITFHAKWDNHSLKFDLSASDEPAGNLLENYRKSAEKVASEWFLDMLSSRIVGFERVEIEAIRQPAKYQDKSSFFYVQTLIIKIPDNDYENGQLERWIEKFRKEIKFFKIMTADASQQAVNISGDIIIGVDEGRLELIGRFIIPREVFARIKAKTVILQDSSSEPSDIDKDYVVYVLEYWLDHMERVSELTLSGPAYEGIGGELYEYMKNKYVRVGGNDETRFRGVADFELPNEGFVISFSHIGEGFNLKILQK